MDFSYRFPAVRGIQANREYYIAMLPMKLLPVLFPTDADGVLPEFRAQRRINEERIPEIKKYILRNRETYVFSALSASIDGNFKFEKLHNIDLGVLDIEMGSVFLINDGQHRKAAIELAMEEDATLGEETISIVFFKDEGLTRSQQMFTDLNKHAVKTSNSLATLYDSRDEIAVATKHIIDQIPFFKKYTDKERDILGKNSMHLFTLHTIYKANQKILHSNKCTDMDEAFLFSYWKNITQNIHEWRELMDRKLTKKAIRENYIISLSITILALGKLGRYFYDNPQNMYSYLTRLRKIDWLRSNKHWEGRIIRENGKVSNSDDSATLACIEIKKIIGIVLSKEEQQRELSFTERK